MLNDVYNTRILELAADIPRQGRLANPQELYVVTDNPSALAAAIPVPIADAYRHRFGIPILETYGMTEACAVLTCLTAEDHRAGGVDDVRALAPGVDHDPGLLGLTELAIGAGQLDRGERQRPHRVAEKFEHGLLRECAFRAEVADLQCVLLREAR